jgi:hypothetical protein
MPTVGTAPETFAAALHDATLIGSDEVARLMLAGGDGDRGTFHTSALCTGALRGYTEAVRVLLADGRADPAANDSIALKYAAYNGHVDVVRLLLADTRADPAADGGVALHIAKACGMERAFIAAARVVDGRVGWTSFRGAAAWSAAVDEGTEIVAALLADGRVNATVEAAVAGEAFHEYAEAAGRCMQHHARWLRRRRWVRAGS